MEETISTNSPVVPLRPKAKLNFSSVSLWAALSLLGQDDFVAWRINAPPHSPSLYLKEALPRFEAVSLTNSDAAKLVLIDALLIETVSQFSNLRLWKAAPLESDTVTGIADYLIATRKAFLSRPFLCAVEAKKDDFEQGEAQCVAEMAACQSVNRQKGHEIMVFGIVSNGTSWQFYRLNISGPIERSRPYSIEPLPELLGALYFICAECAQNAVA